MTSYLNNGYDVIKYFAKFEKFIPHSVIIPSFMTIRSKMSELDREAFLPPPYKIGCQNTSHKLGLKHLLWLKHAMDRGRSYIDVRPLLVRRPLDYSMSLV